MGLASFGFAAAPCQRGAALPLALDEPIPPSRLASRGPERLFATALHVVLAAALVVAHSLEESLS